MTSVDTGHPELEDDDRRLLFIASLHPHGHTSGDLAMMFADRVDPQAVAPEIGRLQRAGLIDRVIIDGQVRWQVTDAGHRFLARTRR